MFGKTTNNIVIDGVDRDTRFTKPEMGDETREGLKETNKRLDQMLVVLAQDKK